MRLMGRRGIAGAVTGSALWLAACGQAPGRPPAGATGASEPYVPGLGELMSLQQMRHAKLWFAGQAGNWPLASYEVDELTEGFDDIVRLHPTHKDSPVAPRDVIPTMVMAPLDVVRRAVDAHDGAAFTAAFDALTEGCNNCHRATSFGFNRVQRPAANPYPNQVFEPVK